MAPWRWARDLEEVDLQKVSDRTSGRMRNPKQTILDIHAPPLNTGLDLAPQLDENLKRRAVGGQSLLDHVGSAPVRDLTEDLHPALSLHGLTHDRKAPATVARTPVAETRRGCCSGPLK